MVQWWFKLSWMVENCCKELDKTHARQRLQEDQFWSEFGAAYKVDESW